MLNEHRNILKQFSPGRIILPVLLGLGVAAWLFLREFNPAAFHKINWTSSSTLWLLLAIVSIVIRDFAYMVRVRTLTDNQLTWYRSFIVIMLWEFSSALVPGMFGGGFLFAIFILNKEGVNMGKSITAIMNSSFLDGIFLATMAPLVYHLIGKEALFSSVQINSTVGSSIFYTFWVVYFSIIGYKILTAYALFINPHMVKNLLLKLTSLPLLNRWHQNAVETGSQLVIASKGLKNQNFKYWVISIASTFASWMARFSIVNCIIHAFHGENTINDAVIYGKQVVMGIIILLSPTPGGSGLAEYIFSNFLNEFIPNGLASALGLLWRILSYYPYIFVGALILPRWLKKHFKLDQFKL
ncbi:MAG: lysylphosphatidylglycerol synthase transmembrane domain-containing protein [Bacteroidota bacterium]